MQHTALLVAALLCAGANGAFAQCVPPSPVGSVFCGSGGRLETGAYMGNCRVSDLLFVHGLDDRVGDYSLFSTDPGADPSATRRGLWVRAGGEGFRLKGNDIPGIDSKAELLQAGGDIWQ